MSSQNYVGVIKILLLLVCFLSRAVMAEDVSYSLVQLEQMAQRDNPTLKQAREKISALRGIYVQEGLKPNPEVGWSAEEMGGGYAGKQGVTITQEIITGGKLSAAQAASCAEIKAAQQGYQVQAFRVMTDTRMTVYRLLTAQKKVTLYKKITSLYEQCFRVAEKLNAAGEVSRVDILKADIEFQKVGMLVKIAENDYRAAWEHLKCVIGNPDLPYGAVSDTLDVELPNLTWDNLVDMLAQTSPEITLAAAKIAASRKRVELECAKNSSNITLEGALMYDTADEKMIGSVGVSVPLRIFNRNQGNISAAHSEVLSAYHEMDRVMLSLQVRLADVFRNYQNARVGVINYREKILPATEEALQLTRRGYERGEFTYLDVLTSQQTYLETHLTYLEQLEEFWVSVAQLEGKLLTGALEEL